MDNKIENVRRGRSKIFLSSDDVARLEKVAGFGLTEEQMAAVCNVSPQTFLRIKKENPGIQQIIDRGRALKKVNVAQRAYDRALEDDKMTRFYLTSQGGWHTNPQNQTTVNVQANQQVNVDQTLATGLEHISQEELNHYQQLKPEDILEILSLENPSTEPPEFKHEPVKTVENPKQDHEKVIPKVVTSGSNEELNAIKSGNLRNIIHQHIKIVGYDDQRQPGKQEKTIAADMDLLLKRYGVVGRKDQGKFFRELLSFNVQKKRLLDPVTGVKNVYYVGCIIADN